MTQVDSGPRLVELRRQRRALRLEHQHVVRWRRLVRGRLELAVAAAAPPLVPGEDLEVRALLVCPDDIPPAAELASAVRGALPIAEMHELPHLRDLDLRLARYELRLDEALRVLTDQYIAQLSRDVTEGCLIELGEPGRRAMRHTV
ncbi:MAG TPA: hypothetical protein VGC67_02525 [Cellulomonas sp.]